MSLLADHRDALPQHHLRFFAGSSVVVQSPVYAAFFDRTVDDALGPSRGRISRLRCAQEKRPLAVVLIAHGRADARGGSVILEAPNGDPMSVTPVR